MKDIINNATRALGIVITMPKNGAIGICDFRYVIKSQIDQTENIHGKSMITLIPAVKLILNHPNWVGNMNTSVIPAIKALEQLSRRYSPTGTGKEFILNQEEAYFEFWYGELFDLMEDLGRLGFYVINYNVDDFDESYFFED